MCTYKPKYSKDQPITNVIKSIMTSKNDLHRVAGLAGRYMPCIWLLQKLKEHDIKVSIDELKGYMLEISYNSDLYESGAELRWPYGSEPRFDVNVTISFMYFYPANTWKPVIDKDRLFDRLKGIHLSLNEQESTIWQKTLITLSIGNT